MERGRDNNRIIVLPPHSTGAGIGATMGTDCMQPGKRGLTVSVVVLGGACLTVMLAYLAFGDSTDESGLRTLRMVSIIFRHGDRSPTEFYPNDPHRNHHWTGGLGALSEVRWRLRSPVIINRSYRLTEESHFAVV